MNDRLRLLTPHGQIEQGWLRRDDMANRLRSGLAACLEGSRHRLSKMHSAFVAQTPERRIEFESHRLLSLWKRLQSVSPQATLRRGFVVIRDEAGKPVLRKSAVSGDRPYEAEFSDGRVKMRSFKADSS